MEKYQNTNLLIQLRYDELYVYGEAQIRFCLHGWMKLIDDAIFLLVNYKRKINR